MVYNKIPSIYGFHYLTNIDVDLLYNWANDVPTSPSYRINQKLVSQRETSLADKLTESKTNAVGTLAILNHCYGWNMPSANNGTIQTGRTIEAIKDKYQPVLLSANDGQTENETE